MSDGENVKVAVRVRPFNGRERDRKATCIVDMKGPTTYLTDPDEPNEEPKSFSFDHSYWSHDGSKADKDGYYGPDSSHPNGKKFADQKKVFDDVGKGVLANAWAGFNSTLFAYGQTGSGKSWSVVGYGINKGIVPQFCHQLYGEINGNKGGEGCSYEVLFSMLEIYMEEVRDLLNPKKGKGGLRVRQHPKKGFYAENLKQAAVDTYENIEAKMEEGTLNRTVASTKMNATSSRAHTIVGITFVQKSKNAAGEETAKSSVVNLVDLAGSERAGNTGATGSRLKEGAAINQSLSALGNVIAALADRSEGKNVKVPFRDSVLTKLLKNALGGNSKTIMIAAISPADINYEETLSTLRYADRAKQIKTKATVNEDPTEKLIRELQEENERLQKMLAGGGIQVPKGDGENEIEEDDDMSPAEKAALKKELEEEYQAQLEDNAREMEEMKKSFEDKLKAAQEDGGGSGGAVSEIAEKKKTTPHMYNLNFDPQLSGKIVHFFDGDKKTVGNHHGSTSDVQLAGPSVKENHAVLLKEGDKIFVEKGDAAARLLVNGQPVMEKTQIHHNDRLMFGTTQMYVACIPKERDGSKQKYEDVTFDSFQMEMAAESGAVSTKNQENKSPEDLVLEDDIADLLTPIAEANNISEKLDMKKQFETVITTPSSRGEMEGKKAIMVRVEDIETEHEWFWGKEKFLDRQAIMEEMFDKFEEGEDWKLPPEKDPFYEDLSAPVHFGSVKIWLKSLAYNLEAKEQLEILDYGGEEEGLLNVEMVPCSGKGKEYTEKDDMFVDDPKELVGQDVHFLVKINSARSLHARFTEVYAQYKVKGDKDFNATKPIKDTKNPDWNFKKQHDFKSAKEEDIEYLNTGAIIIQLWGKQKAPKEKKSSMTTAEFFRKRAEMRMQNGGALPPTHKVDAEKVQFSMELATMTKRADKAEQKVAQFKKLIAAAEEHQKPRLSTKLLKELMAAPTSDQAEKCIKMVPKEKGAGN